MTTRGTALHVSEASAEAVRQMIDQGLAAWGIPIPRLVQDPGRFAAHLTKEGEYRHEADGARVVVKQA